MYKKSVAGALKTIVSSLMCLFDALLQSEDNTDPAKKNGGYWMTWDDEVPGKGGHIFRTGSKRIDVPNNPQTARALRAQHKHVTWVKNY